MAVQCNQSSFSVKSVQFHFILIRNLEFSAEKLASRSEAICRI